MDADNTDSDSGRYTLSAPEYGSVFPTVDTHRVFMQQSLRLTQPTRHSSSQVTHQDMAGSNTKEPHHPIRAVGLFNGVPRTQPFSKARAMTTFWIWFVPS